MKRNRKNNDLQYSWADKARKIDLANPVQAWTLFYSFLSGSRKRRRAMMKVNISSTKIHVAPNAYKPTFGSIPIPIVLMNKPRITAIEMPKVM